MGFEPIRRVLPKAIQQAGIAEQVQADRVLRLAKEHITALWGQEKASYILPLSFQGGTLKIQSRSATALQELKQLVPRLQNDLNRVLGGKVIVCIRCQSIGF